MAFPWLAEAPQQRAPKPRVRAPTLDSKEQASLPMSQQEATLSHFNAAAEIEDAVAARFLQEEQARQQRKAQESLSQQEREAELMRLESLRNRDAAELPPGVETDWAGFVVQPERRKVFPQGHISRKVQLQSKNGYIVPQEDAKELGLDAPRHSKKHFEYDQRFQTLDQGADALPHRSAAYQLGPGCGHDTSHWKTSYQSSCKGEQAGLDHGFLQRDKVPRTRKYKPAFEQASASRTKIHQMPLSEMGNLSNHHTYSSLGAGNMQPRFDMSTAGGQGLRNRDSNLLAGLGAKIANSVAKPKTINIPKAQEPSDKQMLTQNWHHAIPGTTTRRLPSNRIF